MTHETRMILRLSAFAAWPAFVALGLLAATGAWPQRPFLDAFAAPFEYATLALLGLSFALALHACFRLYGWSHGRGLLCQRCGCLLGRERPGKWGRSDYRRCLGCSSNTSKRDYAFME